jgi:glycosyltransferase involved in cell wall biosynthesis
MTPSDRSSPARGRRLEPAAVLPTISVVIASHREVALLDACLASIVPQCTRIGAELIVARAGEPDDVAGLARANPAARFVAAPAGATIPQLRGLGMAEATGDIVALTEDHCIADPHWLEALTRHTGHDADVTGGGMDNAQRERAVDWGAYFSEYGFFAPARDDAPGSAGGGATLLTGANVAYARSVVGEVAAWARQGEWENVAHQRLTARGRVLRFIPDAVIYQNKRYRFGAFCLDRYAHGRDYARTRLAQERSSRRWVLLALSPLLPVVLTFRVARAAANRRWRTFLRALPATAAFLSAWAVGEAVGYALGPALARGGAGVLGAPRARGL